MLVDYHDAELTRSTQDVIYLCSKRFEQISQLDSSTFASNLAWFVKSSYEKIGGQTNRDEHDSGMASAAHASVTVADRRRWLGGDVFSIFFGVGVLLDALSGRSTFEASKMPVLTKALDSLLSNTYTPNVFVLITTRVLVTASPKYRFD